MLLIQEMEVLQELSNPHVMGVTAMYYDVHNFYIVCELCQGGDLHDRIEKIMNFTERDAAVITK